MIKGNRCVIRLGKPGCGKSLDQTETDVLEHLWAGEDVYCCYWINWKGYKNSKGEWTQNFHYFPPTKKGWDSIKDKRNCVVVFDELAQVFDPRDWAEEGSEVRRWFQLHRHFHVDIYANTQDVSLVAKSVGIIADEWQLIENVGYGLVIDWILDALGVQIIRIRKEFLTWQQLKKMASGWELGEDVAIDGNWKHKRYPIKKIIHNELNEYKEELYHYYCQKCCSRQGEKIKDKTMTLGSLASLGTKYCEKHKEEPLIIKETGLYDTDYTPEMDEEEIEFKAFVDSPKGWRKIEYKGLLSPKQNEEKQTMRKKYNNSHA
jgi:hypothetical protein